MVVGGYGAIMAGLARNLDIRLGKAVTGIAERGMGIAVTTADGGACEPA